MAGIKGLFYDRKVVFEQVRRFVAHCRRQQPEKLVIGFGLPQGADCLLVKVQVGLAPGVHQVPVFQLAGGGKHVVRVAGGIRHKMFQHYGEQVFPFQAL